MYGNSMLRPTPGRSYLRTCSSRGVERTSLSRSNLPKPQMYRKNPLSCPTKDSTPSSAGEAHRRAMTTEEKVQRLKKLTPMQYKVTQEKVTERPYSNQYYKHFERGLYSCVVCEEPLFLSSTKYDSRSGWPAFYDIIDESKVQLKQDLSHVGANLLLLVCNPSLARTEVSCGICGAHIGHVFDDGPKPTGTRFCVNSSSLSFTPIDPEKVEGMKRGKEDEGETEKRKRVGDRFDITDGGKKEPLVHLASSSNSCALGSRICFSVPNMESCSAPIS